MPAISCRASSRGDAQRALFLIRALLLLHLQLGKRGVWAVTAQAELAPQLDAVFFVQIVRVVQRIKIKRADGISAVPVVYVLCHHLIEPVAQRVGLGQGEEEVFLLAQNFLHMAPPVNSCEVIILLEIRTVNTISLFCYKLKINRIN